MVVFWLGGGGGGGGNCPPCPPASYGHANQLTISRLRGQHWILRLKRSVYDIRPENSPVAILETKAGLGVAVILLSDRAYRASIIISRAGKLRSEQKLWVRKWLQSVSRRSLTNSQETRLFVRTYAGIAQISIRITPTNLTSTTTSKRYSFGNGQSWIMWNIIAAWLSKIIKVTNFKCFNHNFHEEEKQSMWHIMWWVIIAKTNHTRVAKEGHGSRK